MQRWTAIELIDKLEWRPRLLHYGLLHMGDELAEGNEEQIREDLSMLALEVVQIVEGTHGSSSDECGHGLGNEGPLGPLPPNVLDGLEGGSMEAV